MDSLTQIILGAAVGEVVAGRKLGNRAMLWGAIAGTIPDLDVLGNFFMSEIDSLAFHRGISHSIFFAFTASLFLAWYTSWLYRNNFYKTKAFRNFTSIIGFLVMVLLGSIWSSLIGIIAGKIGLTIGIITVVAALIYLSSRLWRNYTINLDDEVDHSWALWYKLFFWAIVTHPILDCFTTYGTQLFAPFSDYRVAFSNISVADPLYTVPFLLFLISAAFYKRHTNTRKWLTYLGIGISSLYMVVTIFNKTRIEGVLEKTLVEQELKYKRYTTNPSILNNMLWSATVETDSFYYQGMYSIFDKEEKFKLTPVPKNIDYIYGHENDRTIQILKWFSNDYIGIIKRSDGRLQLNDMRYGTFRQSNNSEDDYIFRFVVEPDEKGELQLSESFGGPPDEDRVGMMGTLMSRIKGI